MPLLTAATMIRSGLSPAKTDRKPWCSSPIRFPAGITASSKNTVYCRSGAVTSTSMTCHDSPGVSVGTTKSDNRAWPVSSSVPVRATRRRASASSTPEM